MHGANGGHPSDGGLSCAICRLREIGPNENEDLKDAVFFLLLWIPVGLVSSVLACDCREEPRASVWWCVVLQDFDI